MLIIQATSVLLTNVSEHFDARLSNLLMLSELKLQFNYNITIFKHFTKIFHKQYPDSRVNQGTIIDGQTCTTKEPKQI
jgi:hypothetical protein